MQEFQSPSFRNENMLQFEALLFIGLIIAGALFRRGRVIEGLWIVVLGYMALSSVRHVPIFVTVTAPMIAAEMTDWWKTWVGDASRKSAAGILNQMGCDLARGFSAPASGRWWWLQRWCSAGRRLRGPGLSQRILPDRWFTPMSRKFCRRAC